MGSPIKFNSIDFLLAGGRKTDQELKLQEHLVKGYDERKAITRLINAVMQPLIAQQPINLQIQRDATNGKLNWTLNGTGVDLNAQTANDPSFFARLKHAWNMTFDSEYAALFNQSVTAVVSTYHQFQNNETAAPAKAKKDAADAEEARKAAEKLAADNLAAQQKQGRIDGLTTKIAGTQSAIDQMTAKHQGQTTQKQTLEGELVTLQARLTKEKRRLEARKDRLDNMMAIHDKIPDTNTLWLTWTVTPGKSTPTDQEMQQFRQDFVNAAKGQVPKADGTGTEKDKAHFNFKIADNPSYDTREAAIKKMKTRCQEQEGRVGEAATAVTKKEAEIVTINAMIQSSAEGITQLGAEKTRLEAELAREQAPPPAQPAAAGPRAPTIQELEAEFVGKLNSTEVHLREILMKPADDVEEMPSSVANFILGLVKGRDGVRTTINGKEYLFSGMNPYEATIDFGDPLKGVIAVNNEVTLKYFDRGWILGGDIEFINEDGHKFNLDGTRLEVDARHMTMKVDSSKQRFWDRSYFAGMKPIAHDEVNQRIFSPNFLV